MGLYIKGAGMPKSCYECELNLRTGICPAFCEWIENNPYSIKSNGRLPNCPLLEVKTPHGRLIDEKDLSDRVLKWLPPDPCGKVELEYPIEADICVSLMMDIEESETIIESEGVVT